ncbi:hypothetical protein Pmar_PMAR023925 [Perkinsus marinus ATCC 50983]|uniref:Uncharacterized protein n=1 Tax=Perkinsus marinus (strain ATCC 50983 / TXsc) TaxID=423536 RepID=C5KR19_PERM5|nr:hypothetical protein Pmar_PMAR023925 [Perkinsus marinus ATCC 50983]EER13075.1 hypothetical protein Pmar_PMAR023925 [Perkinsus marinus ATCC 50983]|eukprot:XP_002781280.1 hypothetical protein Pmar_PMAR023925 [Perkinsus marinus ATCC 50983]
MAAADSDASVGGSHGYNVVARDHTHERRLDGITDDGYSNPLWEHYQHSQHKKHSADWHGGGSSRKGHGKGKHPQQDGGRRSSGGSPGNWKKGRGRGGGSSHYKTYTPNVGTGMLNRENIPVTDEEWGEGALILTQESPAAPAEGAEKSKLSKVSHHAPAPQEDVDPEVLRATLEALTLGGSVAHGGSVPEDDASNTDAVEDTTDGPRLRVDKEVGKRQRCVSFVIMLV